MALWAEHAHFSPKTRMFCSRGEPFCVDLQSHAATRSSRSLTFIRKNEIWDEPMRYAQRVSFLVLQISCLFLSLSNGVAARGTKGFSIEGRIQDESGTKVWGAQVELRDATWKVLLATTSTGNGYFSFARVTAGQYEIAVTKHGFLTLYSPISIPL